MIENNNDDRNFSLLVFIVYLLCIDYQKKLQCARIASLTTIMYLKR